MVSNDFMWFYLLFFLMIPLMRFTPRIIRYVQKNNPLRGITGVDHNNQNQLQNMDRNRTYHENKEMREESSPPSSKNQTKDMQVLGELNRGITKFEDIQRNTNIGRDELDSILGDLENRRLMEVKRKKGFLGTQVELHPTQEGFWKYYS